ncbi:MAG: hypothetical protein LM580_04165 [Thermofilum sp.]|jgi:hypothetical protein|nr:hypothetical protein [Thermofilum sp.]
MLVSLAAYSVAMAAVAAELAYGAWLLSTPSPHLKSRGYEVIYSALESCVAGILLAAVLVGAPSLLSVFGVSYLPPASAAALYAVARDRYVAYVMDLSNVARDLTLTGVLSPLASTWYAASGLANIFSSYLVALSSALLVASRFCQLFGAPLASLGVVLTGVSRFRRLGPALAVSVACLEVFAGAAAPYFYQNAASLKFRYLGVPLSGIAQYFAGAVGEVVEDAKSMGEFSAWISLSLGVAAAVSAGAATAAGGLPESLISRLRI